MRNKKDLILDAYEDLLSGEDNKNIYIKDIAKKACIADGGLYYYFKNKDELLDSLVTRYYSLKVDELKEKLTLVKNKTSLDKIKYMFIHYTKNVTDDNFQKALHDPEYSYIHSKSQKFILERLSYILEDLIKEGITKSEFKCYKPLELSQVILSSLVFLLDPGVYPWSKTEFISRISITFELFANGLGIREEAFNDLLETLIC